ncbi:TPA: phosphomannomutase [Vibrio parahaemolyticus]|uniref:Phosphomannomutase n=1 Tax=Vibrio parahaemolyticus TaxID=670 RepID=A0A5P4S964_VIBPH|nr:phosphomannomutase [Vibrio parahaemolyticus]EJE4554122.1 phosphomannomutase [Vibrio parahaemolyticus]QFC18362.1 Phosphomannomutase [Vibrio parahaemolyticus]QOS16134.1 phosphoglucosamine mutase [Vibrio parahaemolyticus]HCH0377947.1 phosphomannomutase [Vibrio parahaemolyticus]HCH1503815.1 phosphomannomutase [Vibrio parahaemolyticus]
MLITSKVIADSGIQFGTSGARGLVEHFTPEVCAAFSHAFLTTVESDFDFAKVAVAIDNRPSSYAMAQSCIEAIKSRGYDVSYYGVLPTPALAFSAMQDSIPCIMVTGSHIPFDRNGLKFYRPDGEITKADEQSILNSSVDFRVPTQLSELVVDEKASNQYIERYNSLFESDMLQGKRIGIYEHSSAGRDIYQGLFELLGAEVISLERTDEFVPIDTEAVAESDKEKARVWSKQYNLDFIFSTDGDGDRPLVADENGEWLRGDVLGLLCSKALQIEALAVPVSCNTIIADSPEFKVVSKTRIGSPYVIAEFAELSNSYRRIAGFEANGGYLLGSDVSVNGKSLKALPTRDAVLPALMLLSLAKTSSIKSLVDQLPQRFTHSDRIQNFPTEKSLAILEHGKMNPEELLLKLGFTDLKVECTNTTDGLRLSLTNDVIIHLRPSGNAPELRCYAEAASFDTAKALVNSVLSRVKQL